jgi:pyruvate-formate lyase-activating enzyme
MYSTTYTIIAGNKACPNDCPICISKMTPDYGIGMEPVDVNWARFDDATRIAMSYGVKNALITGKGEPALFPGQVSQYLVRLYDKQLAVRELQTSGIPLNRGGLYDQFLDVWRDLGLDTIALSMYHYDMEKNSEPFRTKGGEKVDIARLVDKLHGKGFNTRLSCVMLKNYIDSPEEVSKLIDFSKQNGVFQLTLRRADRPTASLDENVSRFVDENRLSDERSAEIVDFIEKEGSFVYSLPHRAAVYEVAGQNVSLSTGLSRLGEGEECVRQLIFFPQGWLTTSWENVQGGRLL